MSASIASRPPGFAAHLGPDTDILRLPGEPAWPDIPAVRVYGDPNICEIICVTTKRGRLLVFGHCLAPPSQIRRDFAAAVDDLDLLSRWSGAYALLALREGRVTAAGDLAGQFPIFYADGSAGTTLATHPDVVAAVVGSSPDPVTIAARIACPSALPVWATRSAYAGVHRLPGGHVLRYADAITAPPAPAAPVISAGPRPALRKGADALRGALTAAITARAGTNVSADLSGGFDSSALAFLAARAGHVRTVTYAHPGLPAGDQERARQFAGLHCRIQPRTVLGGDATLPYADLPELGLPAAVAEPSNCMLAWRRGLLRLSSTGHGQAGIHLTGEGGDAVAGATPAYLADLRRRAPAGEFIRHCVAHARSLRTSPVALTAHAERAARQTPAGALGGLARTLTGARPEPLTWVGAIGCWPVHGVPVSWLTRRMRRELADIAVDPVTARAIPSGLGPVDLASMAELRASADAQRYLRELGHRVGVRVHAPYLDDAVVRAGLAVPPAFRARPGRHKPLLAAALDGLVPAAVINDAAKGDYTGEEYRGARQATATLRRLLDDPLLAAIDVIEPAAVRASLEDLLTGMPAPLGAFAYLIASETWLRAITGMQARAA